MEIYLSHTKNPHHNYWSNTQKYFTNIRNKARIFTKFHIIECFPPTQTIRIHRDKKRKQNIYKQKYSIRM